MDNPYVHGLRQHDNRPRSPVIIPHNPYELRKKILFENTLLEERALHEHSANTTGGYDAGAINVNPVQSYVVNSDNVNLTLPGNADQFNFTINQAVTSFNLQIVGFGTFSLLNNYDANNFANCYLSAYNLNNISITYNPVYVTASETLSSNGQYFTIFYTNTGSVLLSIFKSETIEPVPSPTPTLTPTPTPRPVRSPPPPTPSPTPTRTPTPYLTPTQTPSPTKTPSQTPSPTNTPYLTRTPSPTLTPTPSLTLSVTPTPPPAPALVYSSSYIPLEITNAGFSYNISQIGTGNPSLTCFRGTNYDFIVLTPSHPFALRISNGNISSPVNGAYNNDVAYGIASGRVMFTPNSATPDTIYYQCAIHPNMIGAISIKDYSL